METPQIVAIIVNAINKTNLTINNLREALNQAVRADSQKRRKDGSQPRD